MNTGDLLAVSLPGSSKCRAGLAGLSGSLGSCPCADFGLEYRVLECFGLVEGRLQLFNDWSHILEYAFLFLMSDSRTFCAS